MSELNGIRTINVTKDAEGNPTRVRLAFGPHYFVELRDTDGRVEFRLGATHHGFMADASEVSGELEKIINEIRNSHPDNLID